MIIIFAKKRKPRNNLPKYVGGETLLVSKDPHLVLQENQKRENTAVLAVLVVFALLIFLGKAFLLQIIEGEENLNLSETNALRVFNVEAERGVIYDRNGQLLVRNRPSFGLEMNTNICRLSEPVGIDSCLGVVEKVSSFVEIDKERVFSEISLGRSNVMLASDLTKEQILPIESRLTAFPSINVSVVPLRDYLYKDIFAHLIGHVGYDENGPGIVGKTGVEEYCNESLSGFPGNKVVQIDSLGGSYEMVSEKAPISGSSITLYVDLKLQKFVYDALKEAVEEGDAVAGAVVAQDPKTGGILAMVSYPSFDPNKISSGISSDEFDELANREDFPFFNRAISAAYPPASTFKMIMSAAILGEKLVNEYYPINDKGFIQIGEFIYKNWNPAGHGNVDLRRALQVSNDTYFYIMGGGYGGIRGLGITKIAEWAEKFGFGRKSGIGLSGENAGNVPKGEGEWYLGDTYITSIGQGDLLATPLQVNNVTSYFANDGYLFVPQVVKSSEEEGDTDIEVISQALIDSDAHETIRQGLKLAAEFGGTAYPFFDFYDVYGVEVAGKTGTAEFGDAENEKTHAWFTVFGPYDDAEIALTVFLEEGGEGSADAAPVARKIMDFWFADRKLEK